MSEALRARVQRGWVAVCGVTRRCRWATRVGLPTRTHCRSIAPTLLLGWLALGALLPPEATAQSTPKAAPPELTLESLFHPERRHDYVADVPSAHWINDEPARLVVERESGWQELDLDTGEESAWAVVEQLTERIDGLDGVDGERAQTIARRVAGQLNRSDEVSLVRIDQALAIVSTAAPARWLTRDASKWENPTLDPTGKLVGYTADGDLYLHDVSTGRSLRLTDDGTDTLLDGILDWTYQEEIYGRGNWRGFWFSADGRWLASLQVDISQIEPYTLTGAASARGTSLVRRYSKAGDPIPHAALYLWDLAEIARGRVPSPRLIAQSTPQRELILSGVWWDPHQPRLLYCVSDRRQTWRELFALDVASAAGPESAGRLILRENSPAWVEPPSAPAFRREGDLIWRSQLPTGRARLYSINANGGVVTPLSPESLDVQDFVVASDGSFALLFGDAEGTTVERHAYRLQLADLPGAERPPSESSSSELESLQRITSQPGWHDVKLSPDDRALLVNRSTATSPPTLHVAPLDEDEFEPIELFAAALELPGGLHDLQLLRIPAGEGIELPALLIRPKTASPGKPSPVVIEVYGGPQTPLVANRWSGNKTLYRELLARRGIGVLLVDNRSSAGRGIADTWAIRHRVGELECQDVLAAVAWLQSQDWVDDQRIAIRGWSFGGFLTLYAMTHSDAFVAGVAGGSVTDWREYDSFYTERYMGLPSENEAGYAATAPVASAAELRGTVLLIHGELDDNVHPSNTLRMAKALQEAGRPFELMIYPGAAHAVHEPRQVWHMARMVDRFLIDQLLGPERAQPGQ